MIFNFINADISHDILNKYILSTIKILNSCMGPLTFQVLLTLDLMGLLFQNRLNHIFLYICIYLAGPRRLLKNVDQRRCQTSFDKNNKIWKIRKETMVHNSVIGDIKIIQTGLVSFATPSRHTLYFSVTQALTRKDCLLIESLLRCLKNLFPMFS